ncbi:hypothetical protein L3Y34_016577 [Caenorhabditis briggsae]|uniref:C-type lectin domain-containing protein n=1 Tax=Caenorhabditis briggsae TaxID=6238 RepID=A0AAE9DZH5_CAEBR|nr:hypothetical protein L3Y34_016577 [Caenorhabditis briggsae]
MNLLSHFLLSLIFWITVVFGSFEPKKKIIIKKEFLSSSSSSSSSSWSSEEHHHHHKRRPHRPRPFPSRPRPSAPRRCPDGWEMFNRAQGSWCVKVFYGPGTQAAALQGCQAQQATLTGVQDNTERLAIAAAARLVINQNGGGQGDVWLGATRKPTCPVASSCNGLLTFDWTDGTTTGIAGFKFAPTEPNGIIYPNWHNSNPWGQQNCLVELISGNSEVAKFGYAHGDMDDQHCQNTFRMYACGKKP